MKKKIGFLLLLFSVLWGSNIWADSVVEFSATSPTEQQNLTSISVDKGKTGYIDGSGFRLEVSASSSNNITWNDNASQSHYQTIAFDKGSSLKVSALSSEAKILKIVFNFETDNNKGSFTEISTTGGEITPTYGKSQSYINAQTWTLKTGANAVAFENPTSASQKAYITSVEVTYSTGGYDSYSVQSYPYTWNFADDANWTSSVSGNQFVSDIWTATDTSDRKEWRNEGHEPTTPTGYDVDLLRGLRFTGHVCADLKNHWVAIPKKATITIPSLLKGQYVKVKYTGVDLLSSDNLESVQDRTDNIQVFSAKSDGDAVLTADPSGDAGVWGVWISGISVLDAAPVLTLKTPSDKATDVDPSISNFTLSSDKKLWAFDENGNKKDMTVTATLSSNSGDQEITLTSNTLSADEGTTELTFSLPDGKKLESSTTYTLNISENTVMETSGTGNENTVFTFTTKGLTYQGAYNGDEKLEDNAAVALLANDFVQFAFDEAFEKTDNFKVIVSDGASRTVYSKDNQNADKVEIKGQRLLVPVTLKAGKSIQITIEAGSLKSTSDNPVLINGEIEFHLISSVKGANLSMTTPYNHDAAPLTTRIILTAKDADGNDALIASNVTATFEGVGPNGETVSYGNVVGIVNGNRLVFTPKENHVLRQGYTYTLTLQDKAEFKNNRGSYFDDQVFTFTTAKVAGNAPTVVSSWPENNSTIKENEVQPTEPYRVVINFNENIQLLDGGLIFCRPVGGSEAINPSYYSAAVPSNSIHVDGSKLWFEYSGKSLYYGMRYEVVIPTYTIVGEGGQPMSGNYKMYFETPKNSTLASDSRERKDVYTWDFTHVSSTSFDKIKEAVTANQSYWGEFRDKNTNVLEGYGSSKASNTKPFSQGQEITAGADGTYVLPEFKGLLFNLVSERSHRFEIFTDETGTKSSCLYMNGNTHYVTLQSVPENAKIFVERSGDGRESFNLNTTDVDSLTTISNNLNHSVSIYQMKAGKDVTFCVQNCKLYRIAIVKDFKTIGNAEKDYIKYATYSQSYPVDFSLNETLNGTAVTAYGVGANYRSDATQVEFTELPDNRATANEGTILKTSGDLGQSHPIFTTDVNTTAEALENNALVGTAENPISISDAKKDGYQNYILTSRYFHIDKDENPTGETIEGNKQCFYKWVSGTVGKNLAYLQLQNSSTQAAKSLIYLDWFGQTTGIGGIRTEDARDNNVYYTLEGIRVAHPSKKGLYILNGKKVVLK